MGMLEQKIVLQAGTKGMEPVVWAPQNDSGRLLRCVLADLEIPSGAAARFWAAKPSGKIIYNDCEIEENQVIVPLTNQTLAEVGMAAAQIEIQSEGELVKTFRFAINVQSEAGSTGTESANESTYLERYLEALQEQLTEAINAGKGEIDSAVQAAEEAAASAETAKENADKAAQSANMAADSANTAAGAANSAANSANTAASEANSAAQRTETAIENAETAAETANGAAQRVETAIETANTAANSANTAAGAANTAAGAANSAASDADSAAQEAREAAERANEAAQEIEGAVSGIINDTTPSANTTYSSQKIESIKTALQETIPPKENILANANFAAGIINTKGKSSYTTPNVKEPYELIDGWFAYGDTSGGSTTLEVQEGSIRLSTDNGFVAYQYIDDGAIIPGKTYTLFAKINGEVKSMVFDTNSYRDNGELFVWNTMLIPGKMARAGINTNMYPCTVEWMKIEEGTEFTGMPQYNGQLETLKAGTYTPINNLNASVPGHPLDAVQGPKLGAWISRMMFIYVPGATTFKFRSRYSSTDSPGSRQSVFIFGRANSILVAGILVINSGGTTCSYTSMVGSGGNLTATLSGNIVTVTLPNQSWDLFTLISGDPMAQA